YQQQAGPNSANPGPNPVNQLPAGMTPNWTPNRPSWLSGDRERGSGSCVQTCAVCMDCRPQWRTCPSDVHNCAQNGGSCRKTDHTKNASVERLNVTMRPMKIRPLDSWTIMLLSVLAETQSKTF